MWTVPASAGRLASPLTRSLHPDTPTITQPFSRARRNLGEPAQPPCALSSGPRLPYAVLSACAALWPACRGADVPCRTCLTCHALWPVCLCCPVPCLACHVAQRARWWPDPRVVYYWPTSAGIGDGFDVLPCMPGPALAYLALLSAPKPTADLRKMKFYCLLSITWWDPQAPGADLPSAPGSCLSVAEQKMESTRASHCEFRHAISQQATKFFPNFPQIVLLLRRR